MDEVFNIDFAGYKNETEYISVSKVRLWPAILASSKWLLKNRIPGHNLIRSGVGLMIINNLAISVEGFITDIIIQQLDNNEFPKPKKIQNLETKATWADKLTLYNELFTKQLETYSEFKSIKILFILRNKFLHGISHSEITKRNIISKLSTEVESTNKKYQEARDFFIEKGFLKKTNVSSNIEILWKIEIVIFLFWEIQKFLFALMAENNSQRFIGISRELKEAFSD